MTLAGRMAGSAFRTDLTGGNTQSQQAASFRREHFPAQAGDIAQVVFATRAPVTKSIHRAYHDLRPPGAQACRAGRRGAEHRAAGSSSIYDTGCRSNAPGCHRSGVFAAGGHRTGQDRRLARRQRDHLPHRRVLHQPADPGSRTGPARRLLHRTTARPGPGRPARQQHEPVRHPALIQPQGAVHLYRRQPDLPARHPHRRHPLRLHPGHRLIHQLRQRRHPQRVRLRQPQHHPDRLLPADHHRRRSDRALPAELRPAAAPGMEPGRCRLLHPATRPHRRRPEAGHRPAREVVLLHPGHPVTGPAPATRLGNLQRLAGSRQGLARRVAGGPTAHDIRAEARPGQYRLRPQPRSAETTAQPHTPRSQPDEQF
jgi:hypothetical protein